LIDALHNDRVKQLQSVAGPDVTDQIGRSVHHAAMEGGEPHPEKSRKVIDTPAMFNYPKK
jgi:hypothetical protein